MKLSAFMAARGLSDKELADAIGVSAFAVRKWRYGERVPRGAAMLRIREATSGAVTADDFLPPVSEPQGADAA